MNKIQFLPSDAAEPEEFYVLEQTKLGGRQYLLVTDSEDGDGMALILRDDAAPDDGESLYSVVEDEKELSAVLLLFRDELEELGIEIEE